MLPRNRALDNVATWEQGANAGQHSSLVIPSGARDLPPHGFGDI